LPAGGWQQNVLHEWKSREMILFTMMALMQPLVIMRHKGRGVSRDTPCLWFPVLVGFSFLWLCYWVRILTTIMPNVCYIVASFDPVLHTWQSLHQPRRFHQRVCWRERTNRPSLCQNESGVSLAFNETGPTSMERRNWFCLDGKRSGRPQK
jgi:hypothetical protein